MHALSADDSLIKQACPTPKTLVIWEEITVDSDMGLVNHEQRSWMQMATMKGSDIQT